MSSKETGMTVRRQPLCAALAAIALAGEAAAAPAAIPEGATYVALGSSFAAGPGIAAKAADSPERCNQSTDNYARQLARARKLKLVDRSCGGATTVDILHGGQFGLPPQLDGLTADTRLVTVTIGGNDVRYMADLGVAVCRHRAGACATPADFVLEQAFADTAANLRAIAAEVRRRSPQARLVFVDYVTILPPGLPCAALAISAEDAAALKARADRLARLTGEAAKAVGADLLQASELTRGHDACAAEPWAAGSVAPRSPPSWGPVSFHPLAPAMTAIARALDERLGP
jgi:lysophospholipase L1-like esterase